MTNKNKIKGSDWERKATELLNDGIEDSEWKRIPGSGALGTTLGESLLTGDISGTVQSFYKKFKVEAKTGYGGEKQFTIKKEWLDKIKMEASAVNAVPFLICKFLGSHSGVKHFVVLDLEVFIDLLNEYTSLKQDFDKVFAKKQV